MLTWQVGEFYETMGLDAVMLVQWANLNPMGGKDANPPRAGCPLANLRATLRDLTNNGLSVVRKHMPHIGLVAPGLAKLHLYCSCASASQAFGMRS